MVEFVPPDEDGNTFLVALGRAVLAAAALESFVLLAVIVRRRAEGWSFDDISGLIDGLGTKPAGSRIKALREAGESPELISRLWSAVKQRNHVIHHLLADPTVIRAVTLGETQPLIDQLDAVAVTCAELVEHVAPAGFEGALEAFGVTDPSALAHVIHKADLPDSLTDSERLLLEEFQGMPVAVLDQLLREAFPATDAGSTASPDE